ncbi:MAG: hypothetical protein KA158_03835 [Leucobacter sp.]|nr:hypothetical protein [Leucobacter sp.]
MHRKFIAAACVALAALAITGCSSTPTGTVTVEVRSLDEAMDEKPLAITVIVGGEVYDSLTLDSGTTIVLEDVPLGHTEINASGYCSVAGATDELNPTMRLIVEDSGCTLTG